MHLRYKSMHLAESAWGVTGKKGVRLGGGMVLEGCEHLSRFNKELIES